MKEKIGISKARKVTSYILQGIIAFFLALGALNNILKTEDAINNSKILGYAEPTLLPLAIFLLTSVLFYVIPATSIFGGIVLTAWFGGAVATHVIHGDNITIILSPVFFGTMVWVALWLRNEVVQSIFSLNK